MRSDRQDDGPSVIDSIAWQLANRATRRLALDTLEVLSTRGMVEQLAERYKAVQNTQRAGHLFEVMHALSFNRDAIAQQSGVRAAVAEWVVGGSPHASSDIDLIDNGAIVARAQAKLYNNIAGAAYEVSRSRFTGMHRLLASDRADAVEALLDRRVTLNPDGLNIGRFKDAGAHVTTALRYDGVSSRPVSYLEAQAAAVAPGEWIADEVREAMAAEFLLGVGTAAGAGAALGALVSAAGAAARVRAGETPAMEAAITACAAAGRTAARSGAAAIVGGTVKVGSQLGRLPRGLGQGTSSLAMGRAVVGVAEAGFAYGRGDIDRGELAVRTARATASTALVWAFSAIGQTVIPIPMVGALAGGFVGQIVGAQCVRGLQMAVVAARQANFDTAKVAVLEEELLTAAALTEELSQLAAEVGVDVGAQLVRVMPRIDAVRHALFLEDDDQSLETFARMLSELGEQPLFATMSEFDEWMADADSVLKLDGNW